MLPLAHRMRHRRDFETAVRRGRRAARRTLVVHAAIVSRDANGASEAAPPARVGLIVSRAVGSAVVRNRVRRRLRAAMRPRVVDLPAGALVVLRANPPAAVASGEDLEADLVVALARAVPRASSRQAIR